MNFANEIYHNVPTATSSGDVVSQCELTSARTEIRYGEDGRKILGVARTTSVHAVGLCATGNRGHENALGPVDTAVDGIDRFLRTHDNVVVTGGSAASEVQSLLDAYRRDELLTQLEPDTHSQMVAAELQGGAAAVLGPQEASLLQA